MPNFTGTLIYNGIFDKLYDQIILQEIYSTASANNERFSNKTEIERKK